MSYLFWLIVLPYAAVLWFALGDPKRFYRNVPPVPKPIPYDGLPLYRIEDGETR